MPAVTISYPKAFFLTSEEKKRFMIQVKAVVASHMEAINPFTGETTDFAADPDHMIDLLLVPYDPDDANVTAAFLATIVTYDWPDRMRGLPGRIEAITDHVRPFIPGNRVPAGQDKISFTFVAAAAWHSA